MKQTASNNGKLRADEQLEDIGMSQQAISEIEMIPLSRAVICNSCDTVSNATGEDCPGCGSGPLTSLANFLSRDSALTKMILTESSRGIERFR